MRTSSRAVVTTAAMLAGGLASAQDPRPVPPQPVLPQAVVPQTIIGGGARMTVAVEIRPTLGSLVLRPAVTDDLALSKDQRAKLGAVWDDVQEAYAEDVETADAAKGSRDARTLIEGNRARARVEQATAAALEKALPDVLNAAQQARLAQIQIQVMGPHAFGDPDVQKALKLTDAQKEQFKGMLQHSVQLRATAARPPVAAGEDGGPVPVLVRTTVSPQAAREKFLDVLTDKQKQAWANLIGKPFEEKPIGFGGGVRRVGD